MNPARILITTSSFAKDDPSLLDRLTSAGYEPVLNPFGRKLTEAEAIQLVAEVAPVGLIAGLEPLTEKVLTQAAGLKVISRCGIGMDNVDLEAAKRLGIGVYCTPDAPTLAVAELTVGLMLAVLRRIPAMDASVRSGGWSRPMGNLITGKTVGIIGCGRIGSAVAKMLSGFECKLLGYDPGLTTHPAIALTTLETLLQESDLVTLHLPYSQKSHQLINAGNIMSLKKGAVVINAARGGVVDEAVLCQALKSGHLGGLGLDCFSEEPYQGELTGCDKAVLTCHVGSYALEARMKMEAETVENLLIGLA